MVGVDVDDATVVVVARSNNSGLQLRCINCINRVTLRGTDDLGNNSNIISGCDCTGTSSSSCSGPLFSVAFVGCGSLGRFLMVDGSGGPCTIRPLD